MSCCLRGDIPSSMGYKYHTWFFIDSGHRHQTVDPRYIRPPLLPRKYQLHTCHLMYPDVNTVSRIEPELPSFPDYRLEIKPDFEGGYVG